MSPDTYIWIMKTEKMRATARFPFLLAIPYFFSIHTAYKQQLEYTHFWGGEGKGVYEAIIRDSGGQFGGRHSYPRPAGAKPPSLCNTDA